MNCSPLTANERLEKKILSRRRFLKSGGLLLTVGVLLRTGSVFAAAERQLRDAFQDDFLMGTMIDPVVYLREGSELAGVVAREFNSLTAGNIFKWDHIHPTEKHWNWAHADAFVEFGEKYRMHLVGHPLVWHAQLPIGLFDNPAKPGQTPAILTEKLQQHITRIVDRYRGRIHVWDVVNEAIAEDGNWYDNHWYQKLGPGYIASSFRWAREADPAAKLLYNDFNLWDERKRNKTVEMIKFFKSEGVPIDGIGIQGHMGLNYPDLKELENSIEAFSREGLEVHISELEVDVLPTVPIGEFPQYRSELDPYKDGLPKEVDQKLAQRYKDIFSSLIKYRDNIQRVTLWGVSDDRSWKNDFPVPGRTNYPLLFDRNRQPKRAYDAVIKLK